MGKKSNVLAPSGVIYRAPLDTALPTDATTALAAAFKDAGFVGEDGLTMSINKQQTKVRDWGKSVVKVIQNEHDVQFSWEYLELSLESAKAFFGDDNVSGTDDALTITINDDVIEDSVYVFDMKDGDVAIRAVVPAGAFASEGGELTFNKNDVIRIPMQIEALKDDITGNNATLYKAMVTAP